MAICVCVSRIGAYTVHPIAMKLSKVVVNMLAMLLEIYSIYKNQCLCRLPVCVCVSYRSTHCSSDCDENFKRCCKHAPDGVGNLIYIYVIQYLCRLSVCVSCIGAQTIHPIAMKLSKVVVNMLAMVLEI